MRRGLSLLEVVMLGAVATILALPILTGLSTASHQAVSGESYQHAEAIAQRAVEEVLAEPWADLARDLPRKVAVGGVPAQDAGVAKLHAEYGDAVGGPLSPRGQLTVEAIEDGLVAIEVELTWPVHPGSAATRDYHLLRLRARTEQSLVTTHALTAVPRK